MDRINGLVGRFPNNDRNNTVASSMDNFFRYLRNIQNKPVPIQISVGATGGFLTSYFMTRISKFFAAIAGISLIMIQFLNYRGYIKFQQNQIQRDLDYLASQVNTPDDLVPTARQLDNFVVNNSYLLGGFTAGSLIGYSFA